MSRWERSGDRDLSFSQWHRDNFGDEADAFDLDLIGTCHTSYCRTPLYKIESTRSTEKPTSMLKADCQVSHTPGILVRYSTEGPDGITGVATMVWPDRGVIGNLEALRKYLDDLRDSHDRLFHIARHARQGER